MRTLLLHRLKRLLWQASHSTWYIPLVGVICVVAGTTLLVPITALVIIAVMLRPERWRSLWLVTAPAAGIGAAILAYTLQQQGLPHLAQTYPELVNSALWQQAMSWIGQYGLAALFFVAALPLPQNPALFACAVSNLPIGGIFVAVAAGKVIKYGVIAWMVATFPERFLHYVHHKPEEGGK